jgi:hypothetical protein
LNRLTLLASVDELLSIFQEISRQLEELLQLVRHDEVAEQRRARRSARGFFLVEAVDWVFVVFSCFENVSQGEKMLSFENV